MYVIGNSDIFFFILITAIIVTFIFPAIPPPKAKMKSDVHKDKKNVENPFRKLDIKQGSIKFH